jgi:hypothetical protein
MDEFEIIYTEQNLLCYRISVHLQIINNGFHEQKKPLQGEAFALQYA